jgi:uncharacterized protein (DUF488 family)
LYCSVKLRDKEQAILKDGSRLPRASCATLNSPKKSAQTFFSKLRDSGAKRVVDVRLNNVSQLAGFTKKDDLKYFLREIAAMDYIRLPILAPTCHRRLVAEYLLARWGDVEILHLT